MSAERPKPCSVPRCKMDPNHTCFRLPQDPERAKLWLEQLGLDENLRPIYVCEAHFENWLITHKKSLVKGAIPTLNLPTNQPDSNTKSAITPSSDNYSDFMENIIVKSLNSSHSQANISRADLLDAAIESSSCTSNKTEHDENSDDKSQNQKRKKNLKQNQSDLYDPDNASEMIAEIRNKLGYISQFPDILKPLALKIYLTCPQIYEMLRNALKLPPVSTIKDLFDGCSISIDNDSLFAKSLQYKISIMSEKQKHCIICLGEFNIDQNLYYNVKYDKLFGVSDINDIQKPEPAHRAFVLTVQGLFTKWKQPIDIAFTGVRTHVDLPSINHWIDSSITNLLKIGYNVRAIVTESEYLTMSSLPHYQINKKQIYYIYDVSSVFKQFYYDLLWYEYRFDGVLAKRQDLLNYYKLDSKRQLRLSPRITEKHVNPVTLSDIDIKDVMEVINLNTAAAMSAYIDFKALDQSAKGMVQLITKLSKLFEVLYSNNCSESVKIASGETHIEVLNIMYVFFYAIEIINIKTKKEVAKGNTFVDKIQSTINSVLRLYEDIKLNDGYKFLSTRRLNLDNLRAFFDRVKKLSKNGTRPTCKQMNSAFVQSALLNFLRPIKNDKSVTLEEQLKQINKILRDLKTPPPKLANTNIGIDIKIKSTEYNKLDLKRKDSIVMLAGFLLKKCYDRHADCVAMKNYICIVLHDTSSICKTILNEIQEGVCVVPQESFIEFVEMMEIRFRSFMTKDILETKNSKLLNGLLMAMQLVNFPMPCPCFPILYAKKLYLRLRIYYMLKHNNSLITSGNCKYSLEVNNL